MKLPFLLLTAFIICGCSSSSSKYTEPLTGKVSGIISDNSSDLHKRIAQTSGRNATGSIFIVGEYSQTALLRDRLVNIDMRDNVNASFAPDGLPDFSGEIFFTLYDSFHSPYSRYFDEDRIEELRDLAVDNGTAALDTVYAISPYDKNGLGRKVASKTIILNSAYFTAFGEYDLSTLFSTLGSSVDVISPLKCMLDEIKTIKQDSYRIAVIASNEVRNKEVYLTSFRKFCNENVKAPSECFVHYAQAGRNPLTSLLDDYVSQGRTAPLNAILIDDLRVSHYDISTTMASIGSVMDEASLKYGPLLDRDCKVVFASDAVAKHCYDRLREDGSFRLMIAKPQSSEYMTTEDWIIPYSDNYITLDY